MTTDEIIKVAFELGTAISESDELFQLRAAQVRLSENKEAYDLIMNFQDAQSKLENKMNEGLLVTPAEENHMQILEQQLNSNPFVQELMKIQEKFDSLMQGVYFAMNQAISGTQDCSGDCGSCGSTCEM
ncbi:MAG: YlbF family regulator [Bacillota bacterium]|nr:YlbF family regulator [Bacillota bacterium]